MNRINPLLRRCLLSLLLALMVASDGAAQGFELRIVFESNHDGHWNGNWDIYSMDVNGNDLLQLTDHPASDEAPVCSPDGKKIVFRSERDLTPDLYVMDSDGSNVTRLTQDNFFESRASWSPDGTKIAFSSFRFLVGNSEVYVMDADGNNAINLTKHKWHDVLPSWSPDGSRIAFESYRTGAFNDPKHIFVMNADGKGRRNLTGGTHLTNNRFSTWSADGRKIAFHSQRFFRDGTRYQIYVATADGEELEQLTKEGNDRFPAYSPDGSKIAFASTRDGGYNIFLMDTNGMNAVNITRTPPGIRNISPSWLFASEAFAVKPNGKLPISWGELKRTGNR